MIATGDLTRVQNELAYQKRFLWRQTDINGMHIFYGNPDGPPRIVRYTAIMYCMQQRPINEEIFQTLLEARDLAHNRVIDVNYFLDDGSTIIDQVMRARPLSLAKRLLQRLIDCRTRYGELEVDFSLHGPEGSHLLTALELGDVGMMRMLLDIRTPRGRPVLNVNEIFRERGTVLDIACRLKEVGRCTNEMIAVILAAGGRDEVRERIIREREREIERERERRAAVRETHPLFAEGLDTHATSVTTSVGVSLKKLKQRYKVNNPDQAFGEVKAFINGLPASNGKKAYALNCLKYIDNVIDKHILHDISLKKVLALIWTALLDKQSHIEGQQELSDKDVDDRKGILLDHLYRAETTYSTDMGMGRACLVGVFNKIVETLSDIHPDVTIITEAANIYSIATDKAIIIVRDVLKRKTLEEQKAILKDWVEEGGVAANFRSDMRAVVDEKLKEEYGVLLIDDVRNGITGNLEYLSPPIVNEKLNRLITEINNIPNDENNEYRQFLIQWLKEKEKQVYDDPERTFAEEYERIAEAHKEYLVLMECLDVIFSLAENKNENANIIQSFKDEVRALCQGERAVTPHAFKEKVDLLTRLQDLVCKVNDLPEDKTSPSRQLAMAFLKNKTAQVYESTDAQARYEKHLEMYNRFHEMTEFYGRVDELRCCAEESKHSDEKKVAEQLANDLQEGANAYLSDHQKNAYIHFQQKCSALIKAAKPVLEKQRSWRQILQNLLLPILGLGIGYAVASMINKAITGNFLFFSKNNYLQKLHALEGVIKSVAKKKK
jgi:hypothetical protein